MMLDELVRRALGMAHVIGYLAAEYQKVQARINHAAAEGAHHVPVCTMDPRNAGGDR